MYAGAHRYLSPTAAGACALVFGILGGCASNCSGDPRTDSAGCAAQALSNGTYQTSAERMTAELRDEQGRVHVAKLDQVSLQANLTQLQGRRRVVENRLDQLALRLKVLERKAGEGDDKIADLKAAIAELRASVGEKPLTDGQIAAEERGLEILAQQVEALTPASEPTL